MCINEQSEVSKRRYSHLLAAESQNTFTTSLKYCLLMQKKSPYVLIFYSSLVLHVAFPGLMLQGWLPVSSRLSELCGCLVWFSICCILNIFYFLEKQYKIHNIAHHKINCTSLRYRLTSTCLDATVQRSYWRTHPGTSMSGESQLNGASGSQTTNI